MNKLPIEKRVAVITALVEGCSMRSTARMVKVSINTVTKLLIEVGTACAQYQDMKLRNLQCRRLQCDEIWSFCAMKQKNVPAEREGEYGIGDVYTWTAIDADTKIVPCWLVGLRDGDHARAFVSDLAGRLAHRVQLTTDGYRAYLDAVEEGFGGCIDYAQLIKLYGPAGSNQHPDTRYSPGECCGTEKVIISGNPERADISTSYVERQNLNMRMGMRRFTRLTNAFSKKIENLAHSVALFYMWYNFGRVHQTLKTTPAIKAGVAREKWTVERIVGLAD